MANCTLPSSSTSVMLPSIIRCSDASKACRQRGVHVSNIRLPVLRRNPPYSSHLQLFHRISLGLLVLIVLKISAVFLQVLEKMVTEDQPPHFSLRVLIKRLVG